MTKRNLKFFCELAVLRKFATTSQSANGTIFFKEDAPPIDVPEVPLSKYAGETTVTLVTGSKIGEEGSKYINSIFQHVKAPINIEKLSTNNQVVPNEFLLSVIRNGTALHIDTAHEIQNKHKSLILNTQLDLYACVVNCFSIPGYSCKFPSVDIAIVMQNNRGDFSKLEYRPINGVVETIKVCNRKTLNKYIEFAFKYAAKHGRKKITFGHKNDELPLSDGLHLEVAQQVHKESYPSIEVEHMQINKITKNLIMNPQYFDLLCLNDKYGTFVTSIVSGICGGAGLFSATEIGDHYAIFKPLQTKLSITDGEVLCPYGTILTAVNLLQHLGYDQCARLLWKALMKIMLNYKIKTKEFGGNYSPDEIISKLLDELRVSSCQQN